MSEINSEINVDRVLQLEQEYQSAKEMTIKQLLERQKETAEQLKALGYGGKPAKVSGKKKRCSKCGAADHDARAHRGERAKSTTKPAQERTAS